MAEKVGEAFIELNARTRKFEVNMSRAQARLTAIGDVMQNVGRRMTLGVTAPIVAGSALAVRSFSTFEAAMRNVNVIGRESEEQFGKTTETVLALSKELGRKPVDLANALYNINSASFVATEGLEVLERAARAGIAGVSDTATAAKALTGVLNAYGKEATEAGDVSDILFKTVEKGVITFGEFAQNMGSTAATANAVGVQFDEVGAAVATMTRGNIKSNEAFTALNRLMLSFLKPSEEMQEAIEDAGFATGEALIQSEGLAGAIEFLTDASQGSAAEMTKLVPSVRAVKAALSLARQDGQEFANDLAIIADKSVRAGATQNALKEQMKALQFQLQRMSSAISVAAIKLGSALAPAVKRVADVVIRASNAFSKMSARTRKIVVAVLAFAAALGPALLLLGTIVKLVAVLGPGLAALASGFGAIVAPALAVLAAVAAIGAAALVMLGDGETVMDRLKSGFTKVANTISIVAGFIKERWSGWVDAALLMMQKLWIRTKTVFSMIQTVIGTVASNIVERILWLGRNWSEVLSHIWETTKTVFVNVGNFIVGIFKNVATNIAEFFKGIWQQIIEPTGPFVVPDMTPLLQGIAQTMKDLPKFEGEQLVLPSAVDEAVKIWLKGEMEIAGLMRKRAERAKETAEEIAIAQDKEASAIEDATDREINAAKKASGAQFAIAEVVKKAQEAAAKARVLTIKPSAAVPSVTSAAVQRRDETAKAVKDAAKDAGSQRNRTNELLEEISDNVGPQAIFV